MTLIHTEITTRWVLQVSDRLLTVSKAGQIEQFDTRSNKTVVFHATDGIATLSYTGLAFLEGTPTDSWIASKLNGTEHPFDPRRVEFSIRFGIKRTSWTKFGLALQLLASELSGLASRQSDLRKWPVSIGAAGWLWYRRKPARPFIAVVEEVEPGHYGVKWVPRQYGQYFLHLVLPRNYVTPSERSQIDSRLSEIALPEDASVVLADSIRRVAARHATVGADCMVVSIAHPGTPDRKIRAEFLLNTVEVPTHQQTSPRFLAYSPWVVGPHECFPPALMVGGASATFRVGIYDFERIGPGPLNMPPTGIVFLLEPQQRKLQR